MTVDAKYTPDSLHPHTCTQEWKAKEDVSKKTFYHSGDSRRLLSDRCKLPLTPKFDCTTSRVTRNDGPSETEARRLQSLCAHKLTEHRERTSQDIQTRNKNMNYQAHAVLTSYQTVGCCKIPNGPTLHTLIVEG